MVAQLAQQRGHLLGTWREVGDEEEVAYCRNCWRGATIDVLRDPHMAGPALSEGCIALPFRLHMAPHVEDAAEADAKLEVARIVDIYGAKRVARWVANLAAITGQAI